MYSLINTLLSLLSLPKVLKKGQLFLLLLAFFFFFTCSLLRCHELNVLDPASGVII